jgi:hypothetical protein
MVIQKDNNLDENNIHNNNINNNLNSEEINNNLREITNEPNPRNLRRGFNIFLLHGLSYFELRTLRLLFHLSTYQQSLLRGVVLDWTEEGMYQREERWLINQLNGPLFSSNNNNEQERDNETERIIRNNNYISLNINENENDEIERRYIENLINFNFEYSYLFLMGFCFGFLVNIFGFLLLFCKFKPRFKIGLICGMLISIIFFFTTILSTR